MITMHKVDNLRRSFAHKDYNMHVKAYKLLETIIKSLKKSPKSIDVDILKATREQLNNTVKQIKKSKKTMKDTNRAWELKNTQIEELRGILVKNMEETNIKYDCSNNDIQHITHNEDIAVIMEVIKSNFHLLCYKRVITSNIIQQFASLFAEHNIYTSDTMAEYNEDAFIIIDKEATIKVGNNVKVIALDKSYVNASGNAIIIGHDNSIIIAKNNVIVGKYDDCCVNANDDVVVNALDTFNVQLNDRAKLNLRAKSSTMFNND